MTAESRRAQYRFVDELPTDCVEFSPNCYVCPNGDIYSTAFRKRTGIIKTNPRNNGSGYLRIDVYGQTFLVHRIVASIFIPNPNGLREVNHIDGDKANNNISNLEWVSHRDNQKHAFDNGMITREHLSNIGKIGGKHAATSRQRVR